MSVMPVAPSIVPTTAANANDDKTTALVVTCSLMLSLALLLRLATVHMQRRTHSSKSRRVCGGRFHFKTVLHALDVSVYIVLWYAISIGMTLFNKWFLRVWADGGYPFATTMTCINMFIKCLLSRVVNSCSSSASIAGALTAKTYWRLAVPIGLCTALDIMLSNLSFFYITVTFYTIVKSGGNVWNLLFSICLGHQRASYSLVVVILLISSGIGLASYGSTQFVIHGFLLVLAASIIGTLRWVLTQSLLKEMDESSNRILAVVYYISPASAVGLLPIAIVTEGATLLQSKFLHDPHLLVLSMGFIFVSGCLAFVLIFVEILLVKKTSALSLGIAGSFKDVTQVLLAVLIFGDHLSPINVCGLVVATSGMLFYTFLKHSVAESELEADAKTTTKYVRVPTSQPDDADGDIVGDIVGDEKYRVHHIQVINMDEASSNNSSKNKRADLVRRESKEYHNDQLLMRANSKELLV
ncbi:Drug/metabolite transporter, partial [Globisporangium splendens]